MPAVPCRCRAPYEERGGEGTRGCGVHASMDVEGGSLARKGTGAVRLIRRSHASCHGASIAFPLLLAACRVVRKGFDRRGTAAMRWCSGATRGLPLRI